MSSHKGITRPWVPQVDVVKLPRQRADARWVEVVASKPLPTPYWVFIAEGLALLAILGVAALWA